MILTSLITVRIMAQFSKEELSFVEDLPKHVEIECPVCLNILTDPHIVSCCGHNFCGSCIERVKASSGSCPMCKEKKYQSFIDKKCSRIINGLEVYCSNKEKGCQWKGELKNMSAHLNKAKREGKCQYEEVKCRHQKCQERKQRKYLKYHEDKECPQRPFYCQYCWRISDTFLFITKDHYKKCLWYPVTCPNGCVSTNMPRGSLTAHLNRECPLEPVDCVFSWAGCNDKPLRKDVHVHTADIKHMTLLAVACGQLKKENEQIKVLKKEVETLRKEMADLKSRPYHEYPLLPVDIRQGSEAVHFYTSPCGRHMSARMMSIGGVFFVFLAFHEGNFDKFKPKVTKIFTKYRSKDIPLIVDTDANHKQLPHNILDSVEWWDDNTVPQGVIKTKLDRYLFFLCNPATIYTQ
uniref:RING-type domain-containing protein n=1 Tax=Amphimedon queenslandica TaxID=400682 RepID=A0A1X7T8A3_AMPQE